MIVRVFRARVHPGKEDEFERFVIETALPMVKAAEGCAHLRKRFGFEARILSRNS